MSFDATPSPYFLLAMRRQAWNATGAIAELVDNSFGPGRGNADRCHITYNPKTRVMSILDNGVGMESIGRLFRLGDTIGRSPGDIGLYGSGGTMALLWLAEAATVYSLRDGMVSHDTVIWQDCIDRDRFPRIDDSWEHASLFNCPPELLEQGHGTLIILKIASERGAFHMSNVRRDLGKMYGPGIRAGKKILWTTIGRGGETEELTDQVIVPDDPDKIVFLDFVLEYGNDWLPVTGQVGLVDNLTISNSGISIGYGARVIIDHTKDCFVSPDRSERYTGSSVTGWLDLGEGWQPYLSTTKSSIDNRPLWDTLMAFVFEHIKALLKESDDEKLMLELDEIALSLQDLFDGAATVTVPRKPVVIPELPDGAGDKESVEQPDHSDDEDDGEPHKDRPARTQIIINPMSDEQIERVLCRADTMAGSVNVYVNSDHQIIQTAMVQKPINRMFLNMVVVNEIANVMAKDLELLRLAFARKPKMVEELVDLDEVRRERRLVRVMADNIRTKTAS